MTSEGSASYVECRPGWRYVTISLDDDGVLEEQHVAALERLIVDVLDGHPYRLYRGERWVIVAVGPPAAAERVSACAQVLASALGAIDEPWLDDRTAN